MKVKLSKHGNSHALVIPKAILDLLNITPSTTLELETNGKNLHIEVYQPESKIQQSMKTVIKKHSSLLQKFANK